MSQMPLHPPHLSRRYLVGIVLLFASLPALAQAEPAVATEAGTPDSTEEPPRKMDLSTPPPPPPLARSARMHNGFYLRGGFGAGGLWPTVLDRSETGDRVDLDGGGFALSFDAMVGGSPADGFALGGAASWMSGLGELSQDGVESTVSLLMAGPFFDAFPDPKDGFHLGAMAGLAAHSIQDHPSGVEGTLGFGGAAWLGYDWWVSHELSAGLLLRFNGALTSGDDGDGSLRLNSTGLTLMATALYH